MPSTLTTIARIPESDADRTRTWVLNVPDSGGGHGINGQTMDIGRTDAIVPLGDTEIWEIQNATQMAHPFHIHGHAFEVLSVDGVAPDFRTLEDTFNVGIGERVRLRMVADNPGDWMTHCHILPHAEEGMMTVLRVLDP